MSERFADLADALTDESRRGNHDQLSATTARLIERYRSDRPARPGVPIMAGAVEAAAYAAYRMPATYAAIAAVLDQLDDEPAPSSQLDIAGGTGAALWAAARRWPGISAQTVLEQAPAAIAAGRRLADRAEHPAISTARWQQTVLSGAELPQADLITIGYLLSEIDDSLQRQVIAAAAVAVRQLLVVVEPGTKNGYRRILAARDQVIEAGLRIIAPCPHDRRCPWADQDVDWCHFGARVNRSAAHRMAKGAELGYEDEKFSYLVAVPAGSSRRPAPGRVLRHPRRPKGRVQLQVCGTEDTIAEVTVAKRAGDTYRTARRIDWGDAWPPR